MNIVLALLLNVFMIAVPLAVVLVVARKTK